MSERMTTAVALGKFRSELIEQGIPENEAANLVRLAAIQILEDGLGVKA